MAVVWIREELTFGDDGLEDGFLYGGNCEGDRVCDDTNAALIGVNGGCVTDLFTPSCFLELVTADVLLVDAAVPSLEDGSEVCGLRCVIDVKDGCTVSLVSS